MNKFKQLSSSINWQGLLLIILVLGITITGATALSILRKNNHLKNQIADKPKVQTAEKGQVAGVSADSDKEKTELVASNSSEPKVTPKPTELIVLYDEEKENDFKPPVPTTKPSITIVNITNQTENLKPTLIPTQVPVSPAPTCPPTSAPTLTPSPMPTPTDILVSPTETPIPTPSSDVPKKSYSFDLYSVSQAVPQGKGTANLNTTQYSHGYWNIEAKGKFYHLQPDQEYQLWLCADGCSSHRDCHFKTNDAGEGKIDNCSFRYPQGRYPAQTIRIKEVFESGPVLTGDDFCYPNHCLESKVDLN